MADIIPWLFILPPSIVTVVALVALSWRYTPAGKAHKLLGEGGRHMYRKEFDEAEALFREGLQLRPDHPALLGTLASMLTSQERFEEAEPLLDKAIQLQPKDMRLKLVKGRCQFGLGHKEEALKTWQAIPKTADAYLDAQSILASYHSDQGDLDRAIALLEDAINSDAGDVHHRRSLKRELRTLKKKQKTAASTAEDNADKGAQQSPKNDEQDAPVEVASKAKTRRKRASRAARSTPSDSSEG